MKLLIIVILMFMLLIGGCAYQKPDGSVDSEIVLFSNVLAAWCSYDAETRAALRSLLIDTKCQALDPYPVTGSICAALPTFKGNISALMDLLTCPGGV